MHEWFIVYVDGTTEMIYADDLNDIYNKITKDVRCLMRVD